MTTMNQLRAWKAVRGSFVIGVHMVSHSELRGLSDRALLDIGAPRVNEGSARPDMFWIPSIF
jgi:hypothetical protein